MIYSIGNRLKFLLSVVLMACCALSAWGQEEIIEHEGNKYIIHVERLSPDKDMTLLDVLHICPELMSSDGKTLTADYLLSVDDILLSVDYEPLLEGIKASELSEVIVCTYGAVNNATDGITGSIDLQFREGKGLKGKLELSGSTYGNGQLFADIANSGENVTVRAFAQTKLQYSHVDDMPKSSITSRNGVENLMVFVDWQATDADLFEIVPALAYTTEDLDWQDEQSRSTIEMKDSTARPEVAAKVENMDQYTTIYVGFPIWWYTAPRIINTFLEQYDLTGKTIIPFATSGGSEIGKSGEDLKKASAPNANWILPGKVLNGNPPVDSLKAWVETLK